VYETFVKYGNFYFIKTHAYSIFYVLNSVVIVWSIIVDCSS